MVNACDECPMRLFNDKIYNLKGIGNPFTGKLIIIPNVDYTAYKNKDIGYSAQVTIIKELLSSTGVETLYILPLIRCCDKISCELNDDIYRRCITNLAQDVKTYEFTDILLLGEAARKFLNVEISGALNTIFVSANNRRYACNYSPLVKFKDANKFEVFKEHLIKWITSTNNNNFNNYKILKV